MIRASYSVVTYIADPRRNEPLNVGIVLWTPSALRLRIDAEAVARVIRENPHLERDALLYLEPYLQGLLTIGDGFDEQYLLQRLDNQRGFPALLSEARLTTLDADHPAAMEAALDRLLTEVVQIKRRRGGPRRNPVQVFARRFQPLIAQRLVERNHPFRASRTPGVPRTVDFFANSSVGLALETARLAVHKADEIRERADAKAWKIEDILLPNQEHINGFFVYCEFLPNEELAEVNDHARRTLEAAGATVMTDIEEAAAQIEDAVRLIH